MTDARSSLQEQKRLLRLDMRAKRREASQKNSNAAKQLASILEAHIELQSNCVIAAYMAFRDEMNCAFLFGPLRRKGHSIALPRIVGKRQPLTFHVVDDGEELVQNQMGMFEPRSSLPAVDPDIILVPLMAFDRAGRRLGYGGGYYDRTIAELRERKKVVTIGVAYAAQEIDEVPVGLNDITLDKIATELNFF